MAYIVSLRRAGVLLSVVCLFIAGCGSQERQATRAGKTATTRKISKRKQPSTANKATAKTARNSTKKTRLTAEPDTSARNDDGTTTGPSAPTPSDDAAAPDPVALTVDSPAVTSKPPPAADWQPPVEPARAKAAGIRRLDGKHIVIYTDLPASPEVDEMPVVFDKAAPLWCKYFEFPDSDVEQWKITGYVMKDKNRFIATKLLPTDLPPFLNGFQRGHEIWCYEQPSAYYRRHLLLHEGTHAFMNWRLGGAGPPWYMEGVAELLGTHRWANGELQLGYFPKNRDASEHWGRVKIIKDDVADGKSQQLRQVLRYGPRAHLNIEPYGWCWAASVFFDSLPEYRAAFRKMKHFVQLPTPAFNAEFQGKLKGKWSEVDLRWQDFVSNIDYGYDLPRAAVQIKQVKPLPDTSATIRVVANRGWQSSGFQLKQGVGYQFAAVGRFQLAQQPAAWESEPNGVTLRYYQRHPLGILQAAIVDESQPPGKMWSTLQTVGAKATLSFPGSGTLYLRLNDSPAELSDNAGEVLVTIAAK